MQPDLAAFLCCRESERWHSSLSQYHVGSSRSPALLPLPARKNSSSSLRDRFPINSHRKTSTKVRAKPGSTRHSLVAHSGNEESSALALHVVSFKVYLRFILHLLNLNWYIKKEFCVATLTSIIPRPKRLVHCSQIKGFLLPCGHSPEPQEVLKTPCSRCSLQVYGPPLHKW